MNDELYFIRHAIIGGETSISVIMWRAGMFSSFLEADEKCRELFYEFLDGDLDKHTSKRVLITLCEPFGSGFMNTILAMIDEFTEELDKN